MKFRSGLRPKGSTSFLMTTDDCPGYRATSRKNHLLRERAFSALYFILSLSLLSRPQYYWSAPKVATAGKATGGEKHSQRDGRNGIRRRENAPFPPPLKPRTPFPYHHSPKKEAEIGEESRGQSLLKFS